MTTATNPEINAADLAAAAAQLATSDTGRRAMRGLLAWLEDQGLRLDAYNQGAVITLLAGAWGRFGMTSRDIMRDALKGGG